MALWPLSCVGQIEILSCEKVWIAHLKPEKLKFFWDVEWFWNISKYYFFRGSFKESFFYLNVAQLYVSVDHIKLHLCESVLFWVYVSLNMLMKYLLVDPVLYFITSTFFKYERETHENVLLTVILFC